MLLVPSDFLADNTVNCARLFRFRTFQNDEVKRWILRARRASCLSERKWMQWSMRITSFNADRLRSGSWKSRHGLIQSKEMQRNWIGNPSVQDVVFQVKDSTQTSQSFHTKVDNGSLESPIWLWRQRKWIGSYIDHRRSVEPKPKPNIEYQKPAQSESAWAMSKLFWCNSRALTQSILFNGEEINLGLRLCSWQAWHWRGDGCACSWWARITIFAKHFGLEIRQVDLEGSMENGSFPGKGD